MTLQPTRRRFTVKDYYRMAKAGILREDDRVELIDGEIFQMSPIGRRHAGVVDCINWLFVDRLRRRANIRVQNPVRLDEYNEPEPDVTLLRPRADWYTSGHPNAEDTLLIVEVAETSVQFDRRVKLPLYARKGIPEVWLLELRREMVTICREPGPDGYRTTLIVRRGDRLAPLAFPDCELAVEELLGETA